VLRIVNLKEQHDWWHIAIIIVAGLLALSYVAATIFWIRNRPVRMDRDTGQLVP
jgi:membrane protein DedA with SNARE-associated domain